MSLVFDKLLIFNTDYFSIHLYNNDIFWLMRIDSIKGPFIYICQLILSVFLSNLFHKWGIISVRDFFNYFFKCKSRGQSIDWQKRTIDFRSLPYKYIVFQIIIFLIYIFSLLIRCNYFFPLFISSDQSFENHLCISFFEVSEGLNITFE